MDKKDLDAKIRAAAKKELSARATRLLGDIRKTQLDLEMRMLDDIDNLVAMDHEASKVAAKFHIARWMRR